jgi:hypothetical protein
MTELDKEVHLYVKTHNETGLKYFGRTTGDPSNYRGSGTYWNHHLDEYGDNVTTEVVGTYANESELRAASEAFSTEHGIVESVEWANLIPESGMPGEGWKPRQDYDEAIEALNAETIRRITAGAHNVPAGNRRFG